MAVKYDHDGPWLSPETGWWRWVIWNNETNKVVQSGSSPSVDECVNDIKTELSKLREKDPDVDFLPGYDTLGE